MAANHNETHGGFYEIRLQDLLNEKWSAWLDDLAIRHESDGTTTLTGMVADQAALHGLLKKIRDLGIPLISVNRYKSDSTSGKEDETGECNV